MRARLFFVTACLAAQLSAVPSRAQSVGEEDPSVAAAQDDAYADTDPSALTEFRDTLEPYGTWTDDPTYGTVWAPGTDQVDASFQPYDTAGSWDYVDGDTVWVSDYAWGWVCFHYGRWARSAGRWVWIPGRVYAGAWVTWRVGDDGFAFVGWAPMAPAWAWVGGSTVALGFSAPEPWVSSPYGTLFSSTSSSSSTASWSPVTGDGAAAFTAHTRRYVPARPSVAQGPTLQSIPRGPSPSTLGIDLARVGTRALNASELRARMLARPSTARPLGAVAPARVGAAAPPRVNPPTRSPNRGAGGPARPRGR
jgi:hypothetical protein